VALDGVEYFRSQRVHCDHCLKGCTKSQDYLGSRRRSIKPIMAM
jgi:hypothetical protein